MKTVLIMAAGTLLFIVFGVALLTPEKTACGTYTQPLKYWLSDDYVSDNFIKPICKEE